MSLAQTAHDHRGVAIPLGDLIASLEIGDSDGRLQLVNSLIATEKDMADAERRQAMLRAAWEAAGHSASGARAAITERLEELRKTDDRGVASLVEELLGQADATGKKR